MDAKKTVAWEDPQACATALERRAAQRHPILQRCFIRPLAAPGNAAWKGIAYDVSTIGIGVAVPYPLAIGTILVIEPSGLPGAKTLEARVVRFSPLSHLWLCGCELTVPLTDEQLRDWLAGSKAERAVTTGR